ncbi:MAG: hypothetical protein Q4G69_10065 [Planctomycetia bacterium]|nr:hypothetical protein [Planctomycetia bacterium]
MRIKQFPAEFRVILAAVALFLGWLFAAIIPYDYPLGKDWGFKLPVERLQKAKDSVQPTLLPGGVPAPILPEKGADPRADLSSKNPAIAQKSDSPDKKAPQKEKGLPRRSKPGSGYIVLDETNLKTVPGKEKSSAVQITNKPNFDMEILESDAPQAAAEWVSKGDAAKREEELRQLAREMKTDEFEEPSFEKKDPLRWEDNIKPKLEGSDPSASATKKEAQSSKGDPAPDPNKPAVKKAVSSKGNRDRKKAELPKKSEPQKADTQKIALPKPDKVLSAKEPEIKAPSINQAIKPEVKIAADPKKIEGSLNQPIPLTDSKAPALELHSLNIPKDHLPGSLADQSRQPNPAPELNQGNVVLIPSTVPEEKSGQIRSSSHIEKLPRFASPDPNAILVPIPPVKSPSSAEKTLSEKDPGSVVYLKPNVRSDKTVVSRIATESTAPPALSELKIHIAHTGENPESIRKLYGLSEKKYAFLISLNKNGLDPNGNFPDGTKVFIP